MGLMCGGAREGEGGTWHVIACVCGRHCQGELCAEEKERKPVRVMSGSVCVEGNGDC